MVSLMFYLLALATGFAIQLVIPNPGRQFFDVFVGLVAGFVALKFLFFLPLAVFAGILLRILVSGYIYCSVPMIISLILGLSLGYL